MSVLKLYHAGYCVIEKPDIYYGRINADFGQGFYMSDSEEFAKRWIKQRNDSTAYINCYELETDGLEIKTLERGAEWFEYIRANRALRPDSLSGYDVITGTVANDTIFDTLGFTTSGILTPEQALKALMTDPEYSQTVLKSERAVSQLRFVKAEIITYDESKRYAAALAKEEEQFAQAFFETVNVILETKEQDQ